MGSDDTDTDYRPRRSARGGAITVYSLVEGGELHKVTIDVDEISASSPEYLVDGRIVVPEATTGKSSLTGFVKAIELRFEGP